MTNWERKLRDVLVSKEKLEKERMFLNSVIKTGERAVYTDALQMTKRIESTEDWKNKLRDVERKLNKLQEENQIALALPHLMADDMDG